MQMIHSKAVQFQRLQFDENQRIKGVNANTGNSEVIYCHFEYISTSPEPVNE